MITMNLSVQKRLSAQLLRCGEGRVVFDTERLSDIKEGITKEDIRGLIAKGFIRAAPLQSSSHGRARILAVAKKKGRRTGHGSRKGIASARTPRKEEWIAKIRLQRSLLKNLKLAGRLSPKDFRAICKKAKGGFFRSRRHVNLYLEENRLLK